MSHVKDAKAVEAILTRRVEKILPSKAKLSKLIRKRKIRLYQGFDPTGSLHLGHTIGLRKLMEFANLGHEVIFLFGTGTVLVGDPSQRETARKQISQEDIEENIKNWKRQVEPIVDFNKIKIKQNADWLLKLTLKDIINITSNISAVQLFKRDMFQKRLAKGDTVWFHETMYPLLQGYDSIVMDVDLEIGGTDQEFNMLIGRELMHKMKNKEKFVLTVPMILGTDAKPMSKTSGNCVWLDDSPEDMFGKLMRIPDEQIFPYMKLLTDISLEEISNLPDSPLENKKCLALDITSQFHGKVKARNALTHFETTVQKRGVPEIIETFEIEKGSHTLLEICKAASLRVSGSKIKRTIIQGGVEWSGQKVTNPNQILEVKGREVLKFGKRVFRKAIIKNPAKS
jgi:tyrosyl-tRNA synthetase